jgi:hypothetical protein
VYEGMNLSCYIDTVIEWASLSTAGLDTHVRNAACVGSLAFSCCRHDPSSAAAEGLARHRPKTRAFTATAICSALQLSLS